MKKFYIKDNVCTPYKLILNKVSNYLTKNGWVVGTSEKDSDVLIVGTCAAFHSLENESIGFIEQMKQDGKELVVFGCMPNVSPRKVKGFSPERIIPSHKWEEFQKLIENPKFPLTEIKEANEFRLKEEYRLYDPGKQFVLIQTGCSSDCPYCPHKLGIGNLSSRPSDEILNQIESLVKKNIHTIVLTGNDTGSYGSDTNDMTYPELLKKVLEYPVDIHISQLNADWAYKYRDELFSILRNPKIKDFQVLIQTTSPRLLNIMERMPIVKKLEPYLKKIRELRPNLLFRTDIMIGFPTATEVEEIDTCKFVRAHFNEVAVHAFERFEHTRIEKMDIDFYDEEMINKRTEKAVNFLKMDPKLLVHRGGQVYQTLIDIEKPKLKMRGKLNAK